jgi:hypothetical protein
VGRLVYGLGSFVADFDDRALAHIKAITLSKLRRNESFAFTCEIPVASGSGHVCLWMNAAIPIQFEFVGSREPTLNREWLEELVQLSNSPGGLHITPEPAPVRSVVRDDKRAGERPRTERPTPERVSAERRNANGLASERLTSERVGSARLSGQRLAAERTNR